MQAARQQHPAVQARSASATSDAARVQLRRKPPARWSRLQSYMLKRVSADGTIVPGAQPSSYALLGRCSFRVAVTTHRPVSNG